MRNGACDMTAITSRAPEIVSVAPAGPPARPAGWSGRKKVWWLGFLLLAVATLTGGGLVAFGARVGDGVGSGPAVYTLLHVARNPPTILADGPGAEKPTDTEFESYKKTQMALIK